MEVGGSDFVSLQIYTVGKAVTESLACWALCTESISSVYLAQSGCGRLLKRRKAIAVLKMTRNGLSVS